MNAELTAHDWQETVADGKECKMLEISWWLQLSKRQRLTFLPKPRLGTERSEVQNPRLETRQRYPSADYAA